MPKEIKAKTAPKETTKSKAETKVSEPKTDQLVIAVIKTGGKQYKVKVGDVLKVEKIEAENGEKQEFEDILFGKKVVAEVIEAGKLKKVMVTKFHAKKRYERHVGHRQNYTQIKIEAIK